MRNLITLITFSLLISLTAAGQSKTFVTGKPFLVNSSQPSHSIMASKLPKLVSEGIFSISTLEYRDIVVNDSKEEFLSLAFSNIYGDTLGMAPYREKLSAQKIKFIISGELTVSTNNECLLTVYGTDFNKPLSPFTTKLTPLSQIQHAIDEACDNLNFQIKNRATKVEQKTIQVLPYVYDFKSKAGASAFSSFNYESDFPARNVSNSITVPKGYILIPYDFNSIKNGRKAEVIVNGKVILETERCTIETTIIVNNYGPFRLVSIDKPSNKDQLLTKTLSDVQGVMNAINSGDLDRMVSILNGQQPMAELQASIEEEIASGHLVSARLFTEHLATKFKEQLNGAGYYRGVILFKEGSYAEARNEFLVHADQMKVLEVKTWRDKTNYYLGLCNNNLGRYEASRRYLWLVSPNRSFKDLSYQKGLCLFKLDSLTKAMPFFKAQIETDAEAAPEVYGYAGLTAQLTGDWTAAEKYFMDGLLSNPNDPVLRKFASDFYNDLATREGNENQSGKALDHYIESYKLTKQFPALMGAVKQSIILKKPDEEIDRLVDTGLADKVFNSNIYLNVATMCREYIDPATSKNSAELLLKASRYLYRYMQATGKPQYNLLGSSYFRLSILDPSKPAYLDSAENNYKKAIGKRRSLGGLMNLAELQLRRMKTDSALKSLGEVNAMIEKDVKLEDTVNRNYYKALYYLYSSQAKILKKNNSSKDQSALTTMIKKHGNMQPPLFQSWNFTSYVIWVKTNPNIAEKDRKEMLGVVCACLPASTTPVTLCSQSPPN